MIRLEDVRLIPLKLFKVSPLVAFENSDWILGVADPVPLGHHPTAVQSAPAGSSGVADCQFARRPSDVSFKLRRIDAKSSAYTIEARCGNHGTPSHK
jgi:hypothetical protein